MSLHLMWSDIALRLLFTAIISSLVGLDRGEHARPAGLRTTLLVGLAACLAMIQANILLSTSGKAPASFVNIDVMRLPLGILTGVGFIGAGAIVRRENLVFGVTTAATLWFVTVIGLCFGAGQLALGALGGILGLIIISGLREFEKRVKQDRQGSLLVVTGPNGPTEEQVRNIIGKEHYQVSAFSVVYYGGGETQELCCQIRWHGRVTDPTLPSFLKTLNAHPAVTKLSWTPQTR